MDFKIRLETSADFTEVEILTYKAFLTMQLPGRQECNEHFLAHKMRNVPAFLPELDYVAVSDDKIVGNIMYTKSKIVCEDGRELETITFGPVSVLPELHKKGIGSALIRHTINKAKQLGYSAIFIYGHPDYYHRFGFVNAVDYNIQTQYGENFDAFMALELQKDVLKNINGRLFMDDIFNINRDELHEFNNEFLKLVN